jgi:hypothetical protein
MLNMQFSMGRKFTLQPLRRYDVKPPEKIHMFNITFDMPMPCLEKTEQQMWDSTQRSLDFQPVTLPLRHSDLFM